MKVAGIFIFAFLFLFASVAGADLYRWEDDEGTVYITDSMERVPQKYRARARVYESTPVEPGAPERPVMESGMPPESGVGEGLYGDRSEEEWAEAFSSRRKQIDALSSDIENRQRFVETFEAGRRFGQIFEEDKVEAYKSYKEELPEDRERLERLKSELERLKKEAAAEDVPREIWRER